MVSGSFNKVISNAVNGSATAFTNYVEYGFYSRQIQAYLDTFKNVKIILFEDLGNISQENMADLFKFIGVDSDFSPNTSFRHNKSGVFDNKYLHTLVYGRNPIKNIIKIIVPTSSRKKIKDYLLNTYSHKPVFDSETKVLLKKIYKDDILKIQTQINRNLQSWT